MAAGGMKSTRNTGRWLAVGDFTAVEAPGGLGRAFAALNQPAEVRAWIVEPQLHVGHQSGGRPGEESFAFADRWWRWPWRENPRPPWPTDS